MSLRPLRNCTCSPRPRVALCSWNTLGSSWPITISLVRLRRADGSAARALRLRSTPLVLKPEPICTSNRSSSPRLNSLRNSARISAALAGARRSWEIPGGSRWKRSTGVP
ncbi:hypothetical protein D9M71_649030 [compost metagenome]